MIRPLTMMIAAFLFGCTEHKAPIVDASPIQPIQLTAEERLYVRTHRVVTWAVEENRPPHIYVKGVEVKGIAPQFLAIISKKTGLIFKPLMVASFSEGMQAVQDGQIDIITGVRPTPDREWLRFTAPYSYEIAVFVFRENERPRSPLRGGIRKGDSGMSYLKTRFPEMRVIETEDNEESIALLEKSLVDVAIMNESAADYWLHKTRFKMIKARTDYDYPLSFGVRHEDVMLATILSKAIATINEDEKRLINESWRVNQSTNHGVMGSLRL